MNSYKMRCSSREYGIMTTSTPIVSRKRRVFEDENVDKLSPIFESSSRGGVRHTLPNKALLLYHTSRYSEASRSNSTLKKKSFPPLVIANSDSEDEDIKKNSSKIRKSMRNNKESISPPVKKRRVTSQNPPRPTFLDEITGEKKLSKRASRVDAILDEFVKDSLRKSAAIDIRMKSDESIDAMVEKVANQPTKKSKTSRKYPKNSKSMAPIEEEKENFVRKIVSKGHDVDLFLVKNKEMANTHRERVPLHSNIIENKMGRAGKGTTKISKDIPNVKIEDAPVGRAEILKKSSTKMPEDMLNNIEAKDVGRAEIPIKSTTKMSEDKQNERIKDPPEIRTLEEIDWHVINGLEGVFMSRGTSVNYVKINPKCKLTSSSISSFMHDTIIIVEGNAHITIEKKQTKLGPGSQVFISRDYEIINKGVTKKLILLSLKK